VAREMIFTLRNADYMSLDNKRMKTL